jgi:hypothetical protein
LACSRLLQPELKLGSSDDQFIIADDDESGSGDEDKGTDLRSSHVPHGKSFDRPNDEGSSSDTVKEMGCQPSPPAHPDQESETFLEYQCRQDETVTVQTPTVSTSEYYINPKDTLMGISLKLGIDVSAA